MSAETLPAIIERFRKSTASYLSVDEFMTTADLHRFVHDHKLLFLEEESDELNAVYWIDSVFLLWDEELMMLELYKDLKDLKHQIADRQAEDMAPFFEDLATYMKKSAVNPDEQITPGSAQAKNALAGNLAILPEQLDYTKESLQLLDDRLRSKKIDHEFVEENLIPLSIYIGKTYLREYGGSWVLKHLAGFDRPAPMLSTVDNKEINLFRVVYGALTSKHGAMIYPTGIYRIIAHNPFTPHR